MGKTNKEDDLEEDHEKTWAEDFRNILRKQAKMQAKDVVFATPLYN